MTDEQKTAYQAAKRRLAAQDYAARYYPEDGSVALYQSGLLKRGRIDLDQFLQENTPRCPSLGSGPINRLDDVLAA